MLLRNKKEQSIGTCNIKCYDLRKKPDTSIYIVWFHWYKARQSMMKEIGIVITLKIRMLLYINFSTYVFSVNPKKKKTKKSSTKSPISCLEMQNF